MALRIDQSRDTSLSDSGSSRRRRRRMARPPASFGSSHVRVMLTSGSAVSTTRPLGSTTIIESTVWKTSSAIPQSLPVALVATTPPMVAVWALAGSGPMRRPKRRSRALTCATLAPAPARTRAPSSRTSMSRKRRRTSTSMSSVMACPLRLVPPPRSTTLRRVAEASTNSARTSAVLEATTTSRGISRKREASWERARRVSASALRCIPPVTTTSLPCASAGERELDMRCCGGGC